MVQIFTFGSWKTLTDYAGSWATDWRQERGEKHVQPLTKSAKDAIRPPNTKHMLWNLKRGLDRIEEGKHPHHIVAWWAYWCGHGTTNTRSKLVTEPSVTAPGFKGLPSTQRSWEERRNAEFFTRITTLQCCNWQHQYEVPSTDSSISILGLTFTFKCQQA